MYHYIQSEQELGFDAFIAPDDFNPDSQPVNIYTKFKELYAANSQARYIYSYSNGSYPLTLTPSSTEYYRYGYTQGGVDVIVDVPLNGTAVTIFGETLTTNRWVCVYMVNTAKFSLSISIARMEWLYCGSYINEVKRNVSTMVLKYVHFANINSITGNFDRAFSVDSQTPCIGTITIPETVISFGASCFSWTAITKVNMPRTKDIQHTIGAPGNTFPTQGTVEYNFGASTSLGSVSARDQYINLRVLSVSEQNTLYSSLNNCDIIFNKAQTTIVWIAPLSTRGLYLPNTLQQSEIDSLNTTVVSRRLNTQLMANHQLYIGTLITDITNLYLANKKFVAVECSVDNQNYLSENNILYNKTKTQLVKCGTSNTGNLVIQNTVVWIDSGAFNGCSGYSELTFTAPFDTAIFSVWNFATFTGESIYNAIQMLVDGTAGNVKYFYINQATMDSLLAYNSGAVVAAAARFINVTTFIKGNKLSLDAGNPASYPGTGTVWADLSGSGNNGTLVNGVAYSTVNGGVMSFDGVNDYVEILGLINIQNNIPYTISAVFKSENISSSQQIIGNWNTLVSSGWRIDITSSKIRFLVLNSSGSTGFVVTTNNSLLSNSFYILSISYNGSVNATGYKIYLNGIEQIITVNSNTNIGVILNNKTTIGASQINTTSYANIFKGKLNDIEIYDYVITPEQVNVNFQSLRTKYGI